LGSGAGDRAPQGFVEAETEELAGASAQQKMLPVVVHADEAKFLQIVLRLLPH
jgi:hypothetical protein